MRNALARTLYELAKEDDRIVVLVADISPAGAMEDFRREFPSRFINVGIAEQSMIGLAAGLAQRGYRPFCYTIATFALFRAYEFVRDDLAYQNLPVTVVGMGAGLSYSTLGGTHQAVEDVAVAMACPNLTVLAPCDPAETVECARWCAGRESGGPVYMRLGKAGEPDLTSDARRVGIGRLHVLHRGEEGGACIVGYGPILARALEASRNLGGSAAVVSTPVVCPVAGDELDWLTTLYGRIVVLEEASGAPLAERVRREALFWQSDVQIISICLPRAFPHIHGTREQLLEHFGLTAEKIVEALRG